MAYVYEETSRNPFARKVRLSATELHAGWVTTPLKELNLPAMADAHLRGSWLGGAGHERPLAALPAGRGSVPVIRASGSSQVVGVQNAAAFADALGRLAVQLSGGPEQVRALARQARDEEVPRWIARRHAHGPAGVPVTVCVDRRSGRADVWLPGGPVVRVRAPRGVSLDKGDPTRGLVVTVDGAPAQLTVTPRRFLSLGSVTVRAARGTWEMTRSARKASLLARDGRPVAVLTQPPAAASTPADELLPLAPVQYTSGDPLDAVMAQLCAVAFGLGDTTGTVRFGSARRLREVEDPRCWDEPYHTGLARGGADSGPGSSGDGWGGGDGGGGSGSDGGGGGGGDGGGGGGGGD